MFPVTSMPGIGHGLYGVSATASGGFNDGAPTILSGSPLNIGFGGDGTASGDGSGQGGDMIAALAMQGISNTVPHGNGTNWVQSAQLTHNVAAQLPAISLKNARNAAYLKLESDCVKLESDCESLREANTKLTQEAHDLTIQLKATKDLYELLAKSVSLNEKIRGARGHPTLLLLLEGMKAFEAEKIRCWDKSDTPKTVKYYEKATWDARPAVKPPPKFPSTDSETGNSKGKTRSLEPVPLSFAFLENRDGSVISRADYALACARGTESFWDLVEMGIAPDSWGKASTFAMDWVCGRLRGASEVFRLCSGDWKARQFAGMKFSDFYTTHIKGKAGKASLRSKTVSPRDSVTPGPTITNVPEGTALASSSNAPSHAPSLSEQNLTSGNNTGISCESESNRLPASVPSNPLASDSNEFNPPPPPEPVDTTTSGVSNPAQPQAYDSEQDTTMGSITLPTGGTSDTDVSMAPAAPGSRTNDSDPNTATSSSLPPQSKVVTIGADSTRQSTPTSATTPMSAAAATSRTALQVANPFAGLSYSNIKSAVPTSSISENTPMGAATVSFEGTTGTAATVTTQVSVSANSPPTPNPVSAQVISPQNRDPEVTRGQKRTAPDSQQGTSAKKARKTGGGRYGPKMACEDDWYKTRERNSENKAKFEEFYKSLDKTAMGKWKEVATAHKAAQVTNAQAA